MYRICYYYSIIQILKKKTETNCDEISLNCRDGGIQRNQWVRKLILIVWVVQNYDIPQTSTKETVLMDFVETKIVFNFVQK